MSSYIVSKGYQQGSSDNGLPASLASNQLARPIGGVSTQGRSIQSSVGSVGANGQVTFSLPYGVGTGFVEAGSCFLSFTLAVASASGPATTYTFGGPLASCSQLFSALQIRCGGATVENINNYNVVHSKILEHCTSQSYVDFDCENTECLGAVVAVGTNSSFTMPLASGLLNSNQSIPLFLLSAPITIELTVNSEALAMVLDAGTCTITLSSLRFNYNAVSVDSQFEMGVKQSLLQNKLYELPFVSWNVAQATTSQTMAYQMGLNLASVLGAFYTEQKTADQVATGTKVYNDAYAVSNTKVYADGKQLVNYDVDNRRKAFMLMQATCGIAGDSTITSCSTSTTYGTTMYWNGQSLRKCHDADLVQSGSSVQNVMWNIDHTNAPTSVSYFMILYSGVALVDGTGQITIAK